MKKISTLLLVFNTFFALSQKKYPQNYFRSPVEIPIILSGSFGELRSNHFHSGLDIKTQGKEGFKIYAAAHGFVSRIKVSQFGFGKAIYISHPNGYTTVYAHLRDFNTEIQKFVKGIQYKKEDYQTGNIYLKEYQFPVKKGDLVAYSGDTGGSSGPHLHYEIRDTKTEKSINPLEFGYKISDSKPPVFKGLMVYPMDKNARINQNNKNFDVPLKKVAKNQYITDRISANGAIGFGVKVYDQFDNSYNKNGLYSLEIKVNGKRIYYHDVETFSFSESKLINLLIDYPYYKKYKSRIQRAFLVPGNKLSLYENLINEGKMEIKPGFNYSISIIAKDFEGNTSSIKIPVVGKKNNAVFSPQKDTTAYKITAKNFHKFTSKNVTIAFPKNTFYEDIYLDFKVENNIVKVHNPTIPLNKYFTLTFDVSKYSETKKEQLYIANLEYPKYPNYQFTRKKETTFFTTTKVLGNYTLLSDTIKPSVKLLYFKKNQWITKLSKLKVKISDKESGIKEYRATIDDEWILMEYNHKKGILTYNFNDKKLVGAKHLFKIVVSDNVGNTNELSAAFYKKQKN